MEPAIIERIMQQVMQRLAEPVGIPVEVSARHVHLSQEDVLTLFGASLTPRRELSQPGEHLCQERLRLIGPKGVIDNVAILGPARSRTQVEVSLSDARQLGIEPPVRQSGKVDGTPGIILASSSGVVVLEHGLIIAERHLHMTPLDAQRFAVRDGERIDIAVDGLRPVVFNRVLVRVSENYRLAMHIDFDEANCCGWQEGTCGCIVCSSETGKPAESCRLNLTVSASPSEEEAIFAVPSRQKKKLITEIDVLEAEKEGVNELHLAARTIVTPLALDCARSRKIAIHQEKRGVR